MYTRKLLNKSHQEFFFIKIHSVLFFKWSHGTSEQEDIRMQKTGVFFFKKWNYYFWSKRRKIRNPFWKPSLGSCPGISISGWLQGAETLPCVLFLLADRLVPPALRVWPPSGRPQAWSVHGSLIYPQAWETNPQSPGSHRAGILASAPGNTETLFPFPHY